MIISNNNCFFLKSTNSWYLKLTRIIKEQTIPYKAHEQIKFMVQTCHKSIWNEPKHIASVIWAKSKSKIYLVTWLHIVPTFHKQTMISTIAWSVWHTAVIHLQTNVILLTAVHYVHQWWCYLLLHQHVYNWIHITHNLILISRVWYYINLYICKYVSLLTS